MLYRNQLPTSLIIKFVSNCGGFNICFFQSHGVKHVFTLAGGHISPILVASEKLGIRVVDTRHEVLNLQCH